MPVGQLQIYHTADVPQVRHGFWPINYAAAGGDDRVFQLEMRVDLFLNVAELRLSHTGNDLRQRPAMETLDLSNLSRALYNNYLAHATPEDCAIIFSAPGYAKHIVNTARYLDKKKIPQIAITDQRTSPIASYGTTVFTCNNHDLFFYNSVMGYMSVANALIYFSAMDNPEETNKRRGRLSEVRSAIGSTDFVKDGL